MNDKVGIVIVSHSPDVARGAADMVRQMVGEEVPLGFCGGNHDGGPLHTISNLEAYCSWQVAATQSLLPASRLLFDEGECPQDSSIRCKDRRLSLSRGEHLSPTR